MSYVGKFAGNGSWNVTVVDGSTNVGRCSADGSLNVILSPGGSYVGKYHPSGATYVTVSPGTLVNLEAPDGSMYVSISGAPSTNSGQPVTVVSGSLTPGSTGAYYPWIFI